MNQKIEPLETFTMIFEELRCNHCKIVIGETHYIPEKFTEKEYNKIKDNSFLFCSKECANKEYKELGAIFTFYDLSKVHNSYKKETLFQNKKKTGKKVKIRRNGITYEVYRRKDGTFGRQPFRKTRKRKRKG